MSCVVSWVPSKVQPCPAFMSKWRGLPVCYHPGTEVGTDLCGSPLKGTCSTMSLFPSAGTVHRWSVMFPLFILLPSSSHPISQGSCSVWGRLQASDTCSSSR